MLIVDEIALPKQGKHSVGVKREHCGVLGKQANCQVLVSLTLAQQEVPVPIVLQLYLFKDWRRTKRVAKNPRCPSRSHLKLKFFLSESCWDADLITMRTLQLLGDDPLTASDADGGLVIDDTGDRKDGYATDHVASQ